MKRILKSVGLYVVLVIAALALPRLVLYFRVLDASAVDIPTAMHTYRLDDRDSMNPNTIGYLESVTMDSEEVIGRLFEEVRSATLRGTKTANPFERYPVYLMILEYGEGAQDTFMYIEVAANRRITVNLDGKTAYYGYISQAAYDTLASAYLEDRLPTISREDATLPPKNHHLSDPQAGEHGAWGTDDRIPQIIEG